MNYNLFEDTNLGTFLLGVGAGAAAFAFALIMTPSATTTDIVMTGLTSLIIAGICGFYLIRKANPNDPATHGEGKDQH